MNFELNAETMRLRDDLCALIELSAPMEWESIRVSVQATVLTTMTGTTMRKKDGTPDSFGPADGFTAELTRFRAACYEPGRGTWYSAAFTLHDGREPEVELYYDEDPQWGAWPHPRSFTRDLEFFPRNDEHVPDWLRRQIELAGKTEVPGSEPDRTATTKDELAEAPQDEVLDRLTATLRDALPEDWRRLKIEYVKLGRHNDARIGLVGHDGVMRYWDPPLEAWHRLQDLRRLMYVEGEGTWFGVKYKLARSGRFMARYERKRKPDFESEPAAEEYAIEQSRFPRTKEHQPGWYRAGLDQAGERHD